MALPLTISRAQLRLETAPLCILRIRPASSDYEWCKRKYPNFSDRRKRVSLSSRFCFPQRKNHSDVGTTNLDPSWYWNSLFGFRPRSIRGLFYAKRPIRVRGSRTEDDLQRFCPSGETRSEMDCIHLVRNLGIGQGALWIRENSRTGFRDILG